MSGGRSDWYGKDGLNCMSYYAYTPAPDTYMHTWLLDSREAWEAKLVIDAFPVKLLATLLLILKVKIKIWPKLIIILFIFHFAFPCKNYGLNKTVLSR